MPTSRSMVAVAVAVWRLSSSWRARSARFSARRSRLGEAATAPFSGSWLQRSLRLRGDPEDRYFPINGEEFSDSGVELRLFTGVAHPVDPHAQPAAAYLPLVGVQKVRRGGGQAHPHDQPPQSRSYEHHLENGSGAMPT